MAIKFFADLNLNKSELQSVALETLSANPSSPSTGQIYFHTTDDEVKIYNGSAWQVVGKSYTAGGGLSLSGTEFSVDSTVIRTTGAQTKAGNMTFSNNVTITGNLTVNGTQTILNTAELAVEDTNIELNSGASAGADSGISVNRGQGEDVPQLLWDESADRWTFTNDGSTFYNMPLSTEYNNYSLPTATASVLGGVKIGTGISISSGVISVTTPTDNNFTNALKTKLDGIASSADNYGSWTISDGTNSESIGSGNTLTVSGSGATSASYNSSTNTLTISSTDNNTTYSVGDGGLTQKNFTTALKTKLDGIASGAEVNVQSDWNVTDTASDAFIKNKPTFDNYVDWKLVADDDTADDIRKQTYVKFNGSTISGTGTQSDPFVVVTPDTNTTYSVGDGGLTQKNFTTALKTKLDGIASNANNYSLPTATASVLGGVKIGARISISSGVISADSQTDNNFTNALKTKLDGIATGANNYSLPTASASVLGGVKVGTNLSIDGNGVLSATDSDTTYSAGEGMSLSGTTFNNNYHTYVGSVTGATSISVDGTTHDVRFPATIQVYDNEGYQVFATTQMNTSTRDVSITGLVSGDYNYVISGKRA